MYVIILTDFSADVSTDAHSFKEKFYDVLNIQDLCRNEQDRVGPYRKLRKISYALATTKENTWKYGMSR